MSKFRILDGILLVDKPVGESSNRALQQVRHGFRAKKAGHTGTLDPFASGLLVCCFGQATKVSGLLLDADKSYEACLKLGVKTDTADSEGEVVDQAAVPELNEQNILNILNDFIGEQDQVPPMYSALKQDGKRLYELARAGIEVERKARRICIHELRLIRWTEDQIEFSVTCSKGTYVRTLGESLAVALGTLGHLSQLRRTRLGPFGVDKAQSPAAWEAAGWPESGLITSDQALLHWPEQVLDAPTTRLFCHGRTVTVEQCAGSIGQELRVYGAEGTFLGCAELVGPGQLRPKRLFVAGDQG